MKAQPSQEVPLVFIHSSVPPPPPSPRGEMSKQHSSVLLNLCPVGCVAYLPRSFAVPVVALPSPSVCSLRSSEQTVAFRLPSFLPSFLVHNQQQPVLHLEAALTFTPSPASAAPYRPSRPFGLAVRNPHGSGNIETTGCRTKTIVNTTTTTTTTLHDRSRVRRRLRLALSRR